MTNSSQPSRSIKCPQCGLLTFYSPENPYRPFCSERCRLIDLGAWASGDYAIPINSQENGQNPINEDEKIDDAYDIDEDTNT